ncbi:hypothetical protein LEM8419_01950 [Neolewinella maritima]|uniref:Gamma-glutamylcyclotransferase n=2 Tax=Neolewinella maritima TaxID=1383882 RepID=A0ABN8F255_9BACT|nr:hypothetical protein LEM8419_01950 [Neolewinella maritima]
MPQQSHQLHDTAYIVYGSKMVTYEILSMPIQDMEESFVFGLWVVIEMSEIEAIAKEGSTFMCRGKLAANIPFYKAGRDKAIQVYFDPSRPDYKKPTLITTMATHEAYSHQNHGIPKDMYIDWMKSLHDGGAVLGF